MPQQQDCPATLRDGSFPFVAGRTNPARLTESRLRGSSYPELRAVRCDFHEGVLTLRGTVSSFYTTQLAQALAARIPGVEEVVNRIEVKETATCSCSADK
ncbi:MAG TPA: BON domain-containing protein [Pirellulales bacterium]